MSRRSERLVGLCLWHRKFYKISDIDDEDEEGDGDGDGHGCPAGMDLTTHPKPTLRFVPPIAGRYTKKWSDRNSAWHMLSAGLNEKMQTMGADFGVQILWKTLFQLKILR